MLKTKTKTYILMVAVISLWGTIGYKIMNGLTSKTIVQTNVLELNKFQPSNNVTLDTFSIVAVDRDPFLGTLSNNSKKKVKRSETEISYKNQYFPTVTYSGLIKKSDAQDQVFVLSINNRQHLMKPGQTIDSIKFIRGNAKEVKVLYKNQFKTIVLD